MNDRHLATVSLGAAFASVTIQHVAAAASIAAALVAVASGLPVVIDRWRHLLPERLTRHFPPRPTPPPPAA